MAGLAAVLLSFDGTSATLNTASPSVAVDGNGNFLVAWQDDASVGDDIFAARVSPAGRVFDPVALVIDADADNDQGPSVAWNGNVFLVTYQRAGVSQQVVSFGSRVSLSSGSVAEPNGLAISATATGDLPNAVAAGPGSNHASFTTRTAPEAPYGGAQRTFVRQISPK